MNNWIRDQVIFWKISEEWEIPQNVIDEINEAYETVDETNFTKEELNSMFLYQLEENAKIALWKRKAREAEKKWMEKWIEKWEKKRERELIQNLMKSMNINEEKAKNILWIK